MYPRLIDHCLLVYRPIVIEVPHCASIRDREREVVVLRSDNGQTWREHVTPADDTPLRDTPTNPAGDILGTLPLSATLVWLRTVVDFLTLSVVPKAVN